MSWPLRRVAGIAWRLKRNGTVVAWGAGVGSNTNVDYGQNMVPANLTNVNQIAAGDLHSLALVGTAPPGHAIVVRPAQSHRNQWLQFLAAHAERPGLSA